MSLPLLTLLIATPSVGALMLAFVPAHQRTAHRVIGAAVAILVFLMSLPLLSAFDPAATGLQLVEDAAWIPSIGAGWRLAVDGVSLWIILLTTFLTPLILIGAHSAITHRVREFVIAMLVLETAMLGALCATDLLLFYLFWELMLVPMYLLIGIWGGANRLYATVKFFIYTMVGSLLMLVGIIYLYLLAGHSFDFAQILALKLDPTQQRWLFAAFGLAFAIKVPVFPFHTWLPDAHTEAPTAGSVILAGVLLKMGTYGFLRFALPLFPHAMGEFSPLVLVLSVVGIVYGALVAWAQSDVKKLVAYSSVSHLGFVMLGIVALNTQAVEGAILQMVNHGISTGALFILVGVIYERRHTRKITDFGGLAAVMPLFTTTFIIVTMSSIGLPGTNGFVGEFLILSGSMSEGLPVLPGTPWNAWPSLSVAAVVFATSGVILGAVYMLSMVRRVFFGPLTHDANRKLADLNLREILVLAPLVLLIFGIGLFPNLLLRPMHASVNALVERTRPVVSATRQPLEMAASPQLAAPKLAASTDAPLPEAAPAEATR
ncbi:MAG: NADH-quinone oxidoreductase subunit M [Deltaproteobacteria bacterium]|nr:NADH-quinone oxidoreductase subunit M [Deltaproteobacteria bacterium]MCB9785908.1 NADH-quinone oxidoreductase subunit M [Deltaproteobacteria bacterium]